MVDTETLGGLKALYLKQLKERLAALEQAMLVIKLGQADAASYDALQYEVHRLNGTGATYGFPGISSTAERLERHLGSPERVPTIVVKLLSALMKAIGESLSRSRAAAPAPGAAEAPPPQPRGLRAASKPAVLVADDDPAILNLVQELLSPFASVECAQSGRAALDAMERRRFDLVILDYELSDMSGLDVLMQAGRMDSGIHSPVMMLSAMSEPDKVARLIAAGAQNYLVKPVSPGHLLERVSVLLQRRKKIVMVADDDPLIREILRKRLTQRGHEVVLANNGAQALATARRLHPQAIVLDRQMPRLDGLQFLQELRRHDETRSIPVIMLSAACSSDDIYSGYRDGADVYIAKPFVPDQVIDYCESFLKSAAILGEPANGNATGNIAYV
jgi:DNA-binding response OmpR family regulator